MWIPEGVSDSSPIQLSIPRSGKQVPGQKGPRFLITWVREAKPRGLAQDVGFGVGAGQVPIGGGGRGEGVGHREHKAQEPRDAERQEHLPERATFTTGPTQPPPGPFQGRVRCGQSAYYRNVENKHWGVLCQREAERLVKWAFIA